MQENIAYRKIKTFKNFYCDALPCAIGDFVEYDNNFLSKLSDNEIDLLCQMAVVKNKKAGVSCLGLKVPKFGFGLKALEKFGLEGYEILPAEEYISLPTKAIVGRKIMLEVKSLLDYNEAFLSSLADFTGQTDIPVIFHLGRDLKEVGLIASRYSLSPASLLESYGFLDRECYCYGLNFIDKDDQNLLKDYGVTLLLSPRSDAMEGKGAINLYNFVYNQLKFGFASGKCYNIDMIGECRLALQNTSNLMHQPSLIAPQQLLEKACDENGEILTLPLEENKLDKAILEQKLDLFEDENLNEKVKQIAQKIKEEI